MTKTSPNRLHILGYGILVICIGFLFHKLYQFAPALLEAMKRKDVLLALPLWSAAYSLMLLLLAYAWHIVLQSINGSPISVTASTYVYTRSSIAKYLPGNVGHLLGRNLLAKYLKTQHALIATSTVLELLIQISAAGAITVWADLPALGGISPKLSLAVTCISLIAAPIAIYIFGKWRNLSFASGRFSVKLYLTITKACLLALCFFLATGTIFSFISNSLAVEHQMGFMAVISVYAISWFVGLITPGAPAGLGVRETIIITLLSPSMGASQALVLAVIFRIVTTVGDLLFFALSFIPWFKPTTDINNG